MLRIENDASEAKKWNLRFIVTCSKTADDSLSRVSITDLQDCASVYLYNQLKLIYLNFFKQQSLTVNLIL